MVRIAKRNIPIKIELEIRTKIGSNRRKARNLLGEIPGTDKKDEVVMLGAHFDTWHASPNASDNTSGVAVMLEANHMCACVRGVKHDSTMKTAKMSGVFMDNDNQARTEFYNFIKTL